jgi:Protein of unknown function (DUF5818)
LVLCPVGAIAQQSPAQTPEDAFTSRELIAWSQLQTPQPAPQPLPPKDKQIPQPEQPQDQQPTPPDSTQQQPIRSYTGIVLKDANQYLLVLADRAMYRLLASDDLREYENRKVTVSGAVSPDAQLIKVQKIVSFR